MDRTKNHLFQLKNSLRFILGFVGTGKAFEDKNRFYMVLGVITLSLAVIFGFALIIGALIAIANR